MKVFLAGSGLEKVWIKDNFTDFYRLQTFYHMADKEIPYLNQYKSFLLDSGAFSFFGGERVDWNSYVDKYIEFINANNVKHFFELDIYAIIGVKKTEQIRQRIEQGTGRQPLPVFHKRLGIEYYKNLCKEYKYIAISASGQYESKWTREQPNQLKQMVTFARAAGCNVHGLGYTKLNMLPKIPFTSVDSTSWLSGNRFGGIYVFNGSGFDKHNKPAGKKVKTWKTAEHNFYEWVKYQRYAEQRF